jgi:RimJ/RimL family protein N-acetyltransferase
MPSFPRLALRGTTVALRAWRRVDIPVLVESFSDPDVISTAPGLPQPFTESDAEDWLARQEKEWHHGERVAFAVTALDDDAALGSVTISRLDWRHGHATIGYFTRAEARGQGVASAAVRLVSRWCFDTLHLARLELTTAPDNVASQRLAERCGFVREGLLRSHVQLPNGRRDSLLYSLLPTDLAPTR